MVIARKGQGLTGQSTKLHAGFVLGAICSLGAGLFGSAGSAFAQAAPSTEARPGELAEVTVTATRREESLVQVPISISVLTGADLEAHNVQNFEDYARLVPNVSFSHSGLNFTTRNIAIRGIGNTAIYVDDTPISASLDPRVLDVARIEVLRGPQGTLFGESSMGGAVRMITNQPDSHNFYSEYKVKGGYTTGAATPNGGISGVVNFVAIPDKLAIRVVGFVEHQGGWLKRVSLADPYNPANKNFPLDSLHFPYVGGVITQDDQGGTTDFGGSVSAKFDATDNFSVTARLLYQYTKLKGVPAEDGLIATATENLTQHPVLLGDSEVHQFGSDTWGRNSFYLPSLDLNYRGPGFTLHSSSTYFERYSFANESNAEAESQVIRRSSGSLDGVNYFPITYAIWAQIPTQDFRWQNGTPQRAWTQEVRAVSDPVQLGSALKLSGVLGYYWHKTFSRTWSGYTVRGCDQSGCAPRGSAIGFAGVIWPNNEDWIVPDRNNYNVDNSFYGELDFNLFDHLTLTAGDRYYRLTNFNAGVSSWIGWTAGFVDVTAPAPGEQKSTGHSPRFSATYLFNPDMSVYLQAARGFRQGTVSSPNQRLPSFCDPYLIELGIDPAKAGSTQPDSIWNYEVGTKFRLRNPNMILSAAAYDMEWSNIQQNIALGCTYGVSSNSGAAVSRGGELDMTINPVEGLSLHLTAGYQDSHITEPAFGSTQKVGDRLKLVPKYAGSAGFMYTFPSAMSFGGASGNLFISSDYSYTGDKLSANQSGRYVVRIPSYYQINARLGMQFENSELALNIDNVTNGRNNLTDYNGTGWGLTETGTVFGATRSVPIPHFFVSTPRTWTLQFSHHM